VSAAEPPKERVNLSGVSETALLTLNARAREARRRDSVIDDPMAVALVDAIDFDFAKFGRTGRTSHAFDLVAQAYLTTHPSATWRRWLSACKPASGAWNQPFPKVNSVG
jgi:O-methyltransferase involved in polyketide biosynthesis